MSKENRVRVRPFIRLIHDRSGRHIKKVSVRGHLRRKKKITWEDMIRQQKFDKPQEKEPEKEIQENRGKNVVQETETKREALRERQKENERQQEIEAEIRRSRVGEKDNKRKIKCRGCGKLIPSNEVACSTCALSRSPKSTNLSLIGILFYVTVAVIIFLLIFFLGYWVSVHP